MCLDTTHPFVFVLTGRSIMEQTSQPFFLFREMKDKKLDDESMSFSFSPSHPTTTTQTLVCANHEAFDAKKQKVFSPRPFQINAENNSRRRRRRWETSSVCCCVMLYRWWNVSPGSCFSWFNHTQEKSEWDCAIPSVPSGPANHFFHPRKMFQRDTNDQRHVILTLSDSPKIK